MSWNIKQFNFNPNKDHGEQLARMQHISQLATDRNVDILVILEVRPSIKSPSFEESYENSQGAMAIYQLLSNLGEEWQCSLSGGNAHKEMNKGELYAILWKTTVVEATSQIELTNSDSSNNILPFKNRVPGILNFKHLTTGTEFCVMAYHAPNPSEMNEREIGFIKQLALIPKFGVIVCGDFNMDARYASTILLPELALAITNETSLRNKLDGTDSAYDAIFYRDLTLISANGENLLSTAEHMTNSSISSALEIKSIKHYTSDHSPVWAEFNLSKQ